MLSNYHTHTALCKHAEGMPVDYAREAVAHGFQVLGFSDHCPQPDGLWNTVRMDFDQMDTYFASIEEARATYPQLEIHAGFECEFRKDLGDFIPETFLRPGRAEYLLLALHSYLDADGQWQDSWHLHTAEGLLGYARHAVEALKSGWFAAFAHPDVFAHGGCAWDGAAIEASRMILQAAQECRIPLELNCNGFHRKLRAKAQTKSVLDDIEGIGPKRKRLLLKTFKNFTGLKEATLEQLEEIVPKEAARNVYEALHQDEEENENDEE